LVRGKLLAEGNLGGQTVISSGLQNHSNPYKTLYFLDVSVRKAVFRAGWGRLGREGYSLGETFCEGKPFVWGGTLEGKPLVGNDFGRRIWRFAHSKVIPFTVDQEYIQLPQQRNVPARFYS